MLQAKIDMPQLARSIKLWSKEFGDTNDEALSRLSAETCRQLAMKTQPWGIGAKAQKKISKAIFLDATKTVISVMDADQWSAVLKGELNALSYKGVWRKFTRGNILRSQREINGWIENHRIGGKIRNKLPWRQRGIAWHADVTAVLKKRRNLAGIAKGAWVLAGIDVSQKAKKKGLGVGVGYAKWAQTAATRAGVRGYADTIRNVYHPKMSLHNEARHTRSSRILKTRDIKTAINSAFKKVIRYYQVAVHAIEARTK